jgi:O-antigen ligase
MGFTRIGDLVSGGEDYSLSTRWEAYGLYFQIAKANPIIGLGPANVYWYTPLFPIRGYAVNYNSHNNYVDIIAQFGIIGLILFVWLAWEIGF